MTGGDSDRLSAGSFAAWLDGMQAALRGEREADVPCGGCTACCASSQFVHIGPDETDTLAHVPAELLFPAPRMPKGHVLMGYDRQGRCPMLVDAGCSIYEHRPRTCRTYDCRVFPAAGIEPDEVQVQIATRTRRWEFDHPTARDRQAHDAVRAAGAFLRDHPDPETGEPPPASRTRLAVRAVELHQLFGQT
jgi:Fe-S-cluster containining protein